MATRNPIDELVDQLRFSVRGGQTLDEAARQLARLTGHPELVQQAVAQYREDARRIRTLREPGALVADGLESWYLGPSDSDRFWPAYRRRLEGLPNWDEDAIAPLDTASTKIVSLLSHPGMGVIRTRGLVLGYVQSGKTANFTATIAKAADAGYQFFLVLSGVTNVLRNQTQRRLQSDIVNLNPEHWIALTMPTQDFTNRGNVNAFLSRYYDHKVLGVVKKNSFRLRELYRWLEGARGETLANCPVLVIDDEADQATPNTHPDPAERTAINRWLVEVLRLLPKAAYIGYTATPFANFFIDPESPEDLYPRDFIVDLPRSADYYGAERIFGRAPVNGEAPDEIEDGLDVIREIPDAELPSLVPGTAAARIGFAPEVTPSLEDALLWFWMATATRLARGQGSDHSTMLVHTSQYVAVHFGLADPIDALRNRVLQALRRDDGGVRAKLQDLWRRESGIVPATSVGVQETTFDQMAVHLQDVVERTEVKVENGTSRDRIDYEKENPADPGRIYIVVGGNVLSRGLTLEGLSVSFFVRTASAYDTLLQMGRWFGYRDGYADLPRIWMTEDLRGYFYDLATVEREIRYDIERYESGHTTPLDAGVRVRTHPQLAITSRLKMQHAVPARMSFAGRAVQTLVFRRRDEAWLRANLEAARGLTRGIRDAGRTAEQVQGRANIIFRDVPASHVLDFLNEYRIHETHIEMPTNLLRDYIRAENESGRLDQWNVAVVTRETAARLGTVNIGLSSEIPLINRSRFLRGDTENDADLKALMSEWDGVLDIDIPLEEARRWGRSGLVRCREEHAPGRGLLLLYPVGRESEPTGRAHTDRHRVRLDSVEHIIGLALVFPDPNDGVAVNYWTVDLSRVPHEVTDDELDQVAL